MPTPLLTCGCECGVSNSAHVLNVANLTFSTTTFRSGLRAARLNATAGNMRALVVGAVATVAVWRFYVYFASLPSADMWIGSRFNGAQYGGVAIQSSDSKLYTCKDTGAGKVFGASGVTVTTGVWYRIDLKLDKSANPWLIDASVSGTALAQTSAAIAIDTSGTLDLGEGVNKTADIFYDDFKLSATGADYPLGGSYIISYIPNADGTHNIAGANDFERSLTGTDITNATTDAYQLVDDRPLPTTAVDFINGIAPPNATDYVEVAYEDSAESAAPLSVEAIFVHHDAGGAGTNRFTVTLRDTNGGTSANIFSGTTNVGTTITYKRAHFATIPGGGAWTDVAFDALVSRFLVADPSPDVYLDALMLEADYADTGTSLTPDPIAIPLVVPAVSIAIAQSLVPSALAIPLVIPDPVLSLTYALAPSPVAVPIVVPDPTIALSYSLIPDPIAIPLVLPAPTVLVDQDLTPDPIAVPLVLPAPTLALTLALAPDALPIPLVLPAPTLTLALAITPDPIAIPLIVPAPTLALTSTLTPDSIAVPLIIPTPTMSLTYAVTPDPIAVPLVLPAPTLAFSYALTPDPIAVPLVLPDVTVTLGGAGTALTPDPIAIPLVLPAPTITHSLTLTPDALSIPLVLPAPSVTIAGTLAPDPVTIPLVVPAVAITHALTLTPDPVAIPLTVPAVTLMIAYALTPDPVAVPLVLPSPTIAHALLLIPAPTPIPLVLPAPTITITGPQFLTPDPIPIPLVVPPPTLTVVSLPGPAVVGGGGGWRRSRWWLPSWLMPPTREDTVRVVQGRVRFVLYVPEVYARGEASEVRAKVTLPVDLATPPRRVTATTIAFAGRVGVPAPTTLLKAAGMTIAYGRVRFEDEEAVLDQEDDLLLGVH